MEILFNFKMKYIEEEIRLAVDIASGDDGYMSKKVIEIIKILNKEKVEV